MEVNIKYRFVHLFLLLIIIPLLAQENKIKISSTLHIVGTGIQNNQPILIKFNDTIKKCNLFIEQPNFQVIKSIDINQNEIKIKPPGESWGSSNFNHRCNCISKNNKNGEIILSYFIQ